MLASVFVDNAVVDSHGVVRWRTKTSASTGHECYSRSHTEGWQRGHEDPRWASSQAGMTTEGKRLLLRNMFYLGEESNAGPRVMLISSAAETPTMARS